MLTYSTRTIGLIGFVWSPEGREQLQTLVIEQGKISRVIEGKGDLSDIPGITVIELDAETVIFPGLLNLHTHIGYNILPIWESRQVWKNRFQWRSNAGYKQQISGLLDYRTRSIGSGHPYPTFCCTAIRWIYDGCWRGASMSASARTGAPVAASICWMS
jgi:hypothetical protein